MSLSYNLFVAILHYSTVVSHIVTYYTFFLRVFPSSWVHMCICEKDLFTYFAGSELSSEGGHRFPFLVVLWKILFNV